MPFEQSEKEKILESLVSARRQGQLAELSLRFQGRTEEAEKIWAGNARLTTEIDILIGMMMEEWSGQAGVNIKALAAANTKLEAAVDDIRKRIRIAKNVVQVIGLLDDAVKMARKVLAVV